MIAEELVVLIRWAAGVVLVLSVGLIVARLKLPMKETKSESIFQSWRRLWRALRERKDDAGDRRDDLRALRARRVLLVDPDEKSARVMTWKLEDLRCTVARARTGKQGLDQARKQQPDAIIADTLLPDISGADFFAALPRADIPVVFVGVMRSQYDDLRSLGRNVACLSKPYDPEEAAALAGYMLSGSPGER